MTEIIKTLDQNQDKKISQQEIESLVKEFKDKPENKDKLAGHLDNDDNKSEIVKNLKEGGADKAINDFLVSPVGKALLKEFNPNDANADKHPAFLFAKTLAYMDHTTDTNRTEPEKLESGETEKTGPDLNDEAMRIALEQKIENTVNIDNSGANKLIVGERHINVADKSVTFPLEVNNNGALQNLVTEGDKITLSFNDKGELQVPENNTMTKLEDGSFFVRYHLPDGQWQDAKLSVEQNSISLNSIDQTVAGEKIHDTFLKDDALTNIENTLTPIKNNKYPEAKYAVKVTRGTDTNYMLLNVDKKPISQYNATTPFTIGNTGFSHTNEGVNIENGIRITQKDLGGLDRGTTETARETTKGIKGMPEGYSMNFTADGGFDIGKIDGAKYNKMHITPQQADNIKAGKGVLYLGNNAYNLNKLDKTNKDAEVTPNKELNNLLAQRDKQVTDQFNSSEGWTMRPSGLEIAVKSEIIDGIYNNNNEALSKSQQEITLESEGSPLAESQDLVKFENGLFSLNKQNVIINHKGSLRKIELNPKEESTNTKGEKVSKGLYFNELNNEEASEHIESQAKDSLTKATRDQESIGNALSSFVGNTKAEFETALASPNDLIAEAKSDNVAKDGILLENNNESVSIAVNTKGEIGAITVKGQKIDASGNLVDATQKFILKNGKIQAEGANKQIENKTESRQNYMKTLIEQGFTVKNTVNSNGDVQKNENVAAFEGFTLNLAGGKKVENGMLATNEKGESKNIYNTGTQESPTRKLVDTPTHKNLQLLNSIKGLSTKLDDSGTISVEHTYSDTSLDNMKTAFDKLPLSPEQTAAKAQLDIQTKTNEATIKANETRITTLEKTKEQFTEEPDALTTLDTNIANLTKTNETLVQTNKSAETKFYNSLITPENKSLLNKVEKYTLKEGQLNKADGTTPDKITVNGVDYAMKEGILTGPDQAIPKTEQAATVAVDKRPTPDASAKIEATVKTESTTKTEEVKTTSTKAVESPTQTISFAERKEIQPGIYEVGLSNPITIDGKTTKSVFIKYAENGDARVYNSPNTNRTENYRLTPGETSGINIDGYPIKVLRDKDNKITGILTNSQKPTTVEEMDKQMASLKEQKVAIEQKISTSKTENGKNDEINKTDIKTSTLPTETKTNQAPERTDNGLATMKNNINSWRDVSGTKQKLLDLVSISAGVTKLDGFNKLFATTDLKTTQSQLGTNPDGILGPNTYKAMVKELQKGLGVNSDGLLGEQTYAALTKESNNKTANLDAIANYKKVEPMGPEKVESVPVANKTASETTSKNINVAPPKPKEPTAQELYKEREKTAIVAIQDWLDVFNAVDLSYQPTQRNIGNKIMNKMPENFMKRNEKPQDPLAYVNITSNGDIQINITDNNMGISALPLQTISMAEIASKGGDISKAYRAKVQKNK